MIVDFAYTGQLDNLSFWNVERILPLADKWIIPGILDICCKYLEERLKVDNCVGIWRFAEAYGCHQLVRNSRKFLLYHLWSMVVDGQSTEAFGLTGNELCDLLSDDWLNVPLGENGVFLIIKRWIHVNEQKRMKFLHQLLGSIRLGLCSTDFIEERLVTDSYIQSVTGTAEILQKLREDFSGQIRLTADRSLFRFVRIP